MQEWYLELENVSCLERCPQFSCVLTYCKYIYCALFIYCTSEFMIVCLATAEVEFVAVLDDRLALAVEIDCALPTVPHPELLTSRHHCTPYTLPQEHTAVGNAHTVNTQSHTPHTLPQEHTAVGNAHTV